MTATYSSSGLRSELQKFCLVGLSESSSEETFGSVIKCFSWFVSCFEIFAVSLRQRRTESAGSLGKMIVILADCEPRLSPDVWTENAAPPRLGRHWACPRLSISGWRSADLTPAGSWQPWCHFFIFSCSLLSPQWWWSAVRELWCTFFNMKRKASFE